MEEDGDIDEHTHSDQEVGDEQGIADKLDAVHQRRDAGDEPVEDESGEKGTEDALQSAHLRHRGAEKQHREHVDVEHHRVGKMLEEPAGDAGQQQDGSAAEGRHLDDKEQPEGDAVVRFVGGLSYDGRHDQQREREGNHR